VKRKLPERCTPPEVWARTGEHSIAGDVYAFGITLWEIFTLGMEPDWNDESLPVRVHLFLFDADRCSQRWTGEYCCFLLAWRASLCRSYALFLRVFTSC
jgi:hypothetical protein